MTEDFLKVANAIADAQIAALKGGREATASELAKAALDSLKADPDIVEILRWLDYKSCGWGPEERTYLGARKLLDVFGIEP